MGFLDSLLGSGPQQVSTTGPRTAEGQALMDMFARNYGAGGAFDPIKQAQRYAGWQDQIYNAPPMTMNVPGVGPLQAMSPYLRQKNALINKTMETAYSPFTQAALGMEALRKGGTTTQPGSSGALLPLGMAAALWNGKGVGGLVDAGKGVWDWINGITGGSGSAPISEAASAGVSGMTEGAGAASDWFPTDVGTQDWNIASDIDWTGIL